MATETLRPNATGDEESISSATSGAGNHWQDVDESSKDDNATIVYTNSTTYQRDLYNLPASSGSGTINSITTYINIMPSSSSVTMHARLSHKSGGAITDGGTEFPSSLSFYSEKTETYNVNPNTSNAWTWGEIDALQIGVNIKISDGAYDARCTQVYVEVDYTPPPIPVADGRIIGVAVIRKR